jgi:hypothetical protein
VVVVREGLRRQKTKHIGAAVLEANSNEDAAVFAVPILIFFDTSMVLVAL